VVIDQAEGTRRRARRWRSVAEKRQVVNLTLEPGASVALVARAHGLNANQVFKWRRAFERGELVEAGAASTALLPVTVTAPGEAEIQEHAVQQPAAASGTAHLHNIVAEHPFAPPRRLHSQPGSFCQLVTTVQTRRLRFNCPVLCQ
jgi:transposase